MPCEQELPQEKVRGGAVDGMWVIRPPSLSSLSLRDNLVSVFANSWLALSTPLFQSVSGLLHCFQQGDLCPASCRELT